VETFVKAGALGANVLTALLAMNLSELTERIRAYREARRSYGHSRGCVTAMLHTFIDDDPALIRTEGHSALRAYLDNHLDFSAKRAEYSEVAVLGNRDRDAILDHAVKRYAAGQSLIGTPGECADRIRALHCAGVDEITCLIDFGVSKKGAMNTLQHIVKLRNSPIPAGGKGYAK
jgi:alkanesulfonate monooxygenase SsuD/methylene tetrahydromethanopterin reductase-like flavin-dependent oxidoreductase (luciferase family)